MNGFIFYVATADQTAGQIEQNILQALKDGYTHLSVWGTEFKIDFHQNKLCIWQKEQNSGWLVRCPIDKLHSNNARRILNMASVAKMYQK